MVITIDQVNMISDLLRDYNINSSSAVPAPHNIMNDHSASAQLADPTAYRSLNMKLLYIATRTRPDILFPTTVYATRSKSPTTIDYDRLIKVMEYLHGTSTKCLTFSHSAPLSVNAYVDASFNSHWDGRGHTGFTIFPDRFASAAILVKSLKQKTCANSSTEAELIALHEAVQCISWLSDVYLELGYDIKPVETYQDNKSTIILSSEESLNFRGRSKFINRKYFGVYKHVTNGDIQLTYVGTEKMIADMLTKPLVGEQLRNFSISLLGSQALRCDDPSMA